MNDDRATVGIVGLGLVGRALGQRLTKAGYRALGFDVLADACAAWGAAGHPVAPSLADLACRCTRVVLAVFDTAGVLQVLESAGGLLSGGSGGSGGGGGGGGGAITAVVDCSTGDPATLELLGHRLAARGVDFIEAPLSGSSEQIAAGAATMLLGASFAAVERHAALLDALAPQRIHVGGAGMGARAKLATNLVLGLNRAALAEGMVFAERMGIEPATFLALVLATPARSDAALVKGRRMVEGDFAPQSRIRQHLKDLRLMQDAAQGTGQRLPLTAVHAALLQAAVDAGDGDLDNAAILRQLRRETS